MIKQLKRIGIPLFISLTMAWPAQAGIIDLFSVDQLEIEDITAEDTNTDGGESSFVSDLLDPGSILGGQRDLFVQLLSAGTLPGENPGDPDIEGSGSARVNISGGVINFSTDSLASATAKVQYDGDDGGNSDLDIDGLWDGSFGVDLTTGGAAGFLLDVIFADAGFAFQINTCWENTGFFCDVAEFTSFEVNSPITSFISFGNDEFAGVDFTNITALEIVIDPFGDFTSIDLTVAAVRTTEVPEPTGLALFSIAMLGLVFYRRRPHSRA